VRSKSNRELNSNTGAIGPGPRPIVTLGPNPKSLPIYILLLLAQLQNTQL